jgi:hypothetical protein
MSLFNTYSAVPMAAIMAGAYACKTSWRMRAIGENYAHLESRGLVGFIPPHGKYKEQRPGFTYDALTDSYFCSQGKRLAFDRLVIDRQGNARHRYLAKRTDCRSCPVRVACKGNTPQEKRLHDTAYKACYERMLSRLAIRVGKRMMRLRAATVEPILGSFITYYGLRQISKWERSKCSIWPLWPTT